MRRLFGILLTAGLFSPICSYAICDGVYKLASGPMRSHWRSQLSELIGELENLNLQIERARIRKSVEELRELVSRKRVLYEHISTKLKPQVLASEPRLRQLSEYLEIASDFIEHWPEVRHNTIQLFELSPEESVAFLSQIPDRMQFLLEEHPDKLSSLEMEEPLMKLRRAAARAHNSTDPRLTEALIEQVDNFVSELARIQDRGESEIQSELFEMVKLLSSPEAQ